MKHIKILLTISTIFMLLACGGGNKTASTTTPDSTAPVSLYTSAPSAVTLSSAATTSYTIGGGVPPYAAGSSNASVATVSVSGSTLSITGGTAGNATALVLDSAGTKVELALTVGSSTPSTALRTTAPSAITLSVGSANTFTISGGTAPYAASSSNTGVATVGVNGSSLSIVGVATGTAQVLALDSTGTQVVISVTVGSTTATPLYTSAHSAITLATSASATVYTIGGGLPPYAASSSNTSAVTASVTGTNLYLTGLAMGSSTILVLDSTGTKVEIAASVGSSTPTTTLFTTAPSAITLATGQTRTFTISGGIGPYATSSSNATVASAGVSGSTLTIAGIASGNTSVVIFDSTGAQVSVGVTVGSATPVTALYTTAANAITIGVGGTGNYAIAGGTAPYSTSSSNTTVASAGVTGTTLTIIGGGVAGTAQVLVFDATGTQVVIGVTVGSASTPTLYTSAPSAITMSSGAAATSFTIGGGVPPYAASSSNAGVATASVTGTNLSVTSGVVGSATVLVLDSVGAKVELALTVGSSTPSVALHTTAPSAITLAPGGFNSFTVAGGVAPYATSSSNTTVASAGVTGTTLIIVGGGVAGTAQVLVFDATGTQVVIGVTVGSASTPTLYTSAPSAITMSSGAAATSFTIGGGVPPYAASSSNAGVATASVVGTSLSVTSGVVGSATVLVLDSVGAKVEVALTVGSSTPSVALHTTAPSAITLAPGGFNNFTVTGGVAPYAASSSNTGVATVGLTGSALTITGIANGAAQVLVLDSVGTQVLVGVTVGSPTPTPLYTTAPSAVTIASGGAAATYTVAGGTLPYSATSSNTAVLTASVTGSTLSLTGVSAGNASVNVLDATGTSLSIAATVSAVAGTALNVLPSGATGNVGDTLTFTLMGGAPGYSLSVSNSNIANVSTANVATSGGTFTTSLLNVGSTVVTVFDAQGQTTSFTLSVSSVAAQLRLSPSAFIVGENELLPITLNIFGGTPPYRALTSDLVKSTVPTGNLLGSTLATAVGSSTNRCINPVTDGTPPEYIVSGTYDVTFTVIDSLGASATSIMTVKDNGAGLGLGCP